MTVRMLGVGLLVGCFATSAAVRADEIPEKYRETVKKALTWLVKQQHKDGHWGANADQSPVSMTSLAGMALLMEGSTVRDGKYAQNIRQAANWLMERSMKGGGRDGLIGNPVPKQAVKKTYEYLKECTSPNGAVYYSHRSRSERPAITAAAIACLFNAGEYKDELCKKWFRYCHRTIGIGQNIGGPRIGHD